MATTSVEGSSVEQFGQSFEEHTGRKAEGVWAAPGRLNLIGEHTDYSGGLVLPMALPQVCLVAAAARDDDTITVHSRQRPGESGTFPVTAAPGEVAGWAGYAVGIFWALRAAGHSVGGADLVLDSNVPIGAGLSSSASVGCSVAIALRDLYQLPLTGEQLAAIARDCENDFVGAPTGVMDQAVSMNAEDGHLYFLDTRSMRAEQVPFALDQHGLTLLVIDSRTTHEHSDGGYASRRRAVEEGARLLGIPALRDLAFADLDEALSRLAQLSQHGQRHPQSMQLSQSSQGGANVGAGAVGAGGASADGDAGAVAAADAGGGEAVAVDPAIARRVRHVVSENARVFAVVDILKTGADPRAVGPILTAGHQSLRDDFEISTPELDTAVEAALEAGAYGARMTGGGFGGSAIALVDDDAVATIRAAVDQAYAAHGYQPARYFTAAPSAGARRLD